MASELLMPSKYLGETCGVSASVFALDTTINYNKILIYISGI